jgi:biopolymer transport protein ExbB
MTFPFLQIDTTVQPSIDIFALLMKGGFVMIPLALLSLAAVVIIVERLIFFSKNTAIKDEQFTRLLQHLQAGKHDAAAQLCSEHKTSWCRIFLYSTIDSTASIEQTDKLMEEAANLEIARLEKGLNYLSIISGLAPLLGFIGTIIGVITIFFDISVSQDISISVISEGLYKKMVSSATGLAVGIIAYSGYHLFQNSIDGFMNKIQEQSLQLKVALRTLGK